MKKITFFFLLLLIGLAGYFAFQYFQKGGPQEIEFIRMSNIKFADVKLPPKMSVVFAADMILHNPNPFGVSISKMDFDVLVDAKKATHITQEQSVTIPAQAEFSLPLQFTIPLKDKEIFKNLKNVFSGAWKKQAIHIHSKGHIYVNALGTPIKIPFDYQEDYKLSDYLK